MGRDKDLSKRYPYSMLGPMYNILCMLIPSPSHLGNIPLTIGYDIRVYEGVNITINCSPLVVAHPNGSIHWRTQLINPRQVIRDELEVPISATSIELVVPSTSIPNFLQESFRCVVCTSQTECWSNNSIISVVSKWVANGLLCMHFTHTHSFKVYMYKTSFFDHTLLHTYLYIHVTYDIINIHHSLFHLPS